MRIWACRTADKRSLVDFLRDTYEKKPVDVCDVRSVYNALVINFTAANTPHEGKYKSAVVQIKQAVEGALGNLPETTLILDDWFEDSLVEKVDYFVVHSENDADALLRTYEPDADRAKEISRLHDITSIIKTRCPGKLLRLEYEQRLRDLFTIDEAGEHGVLLRINPDSLQTMKTEKRRGPSAAEQAARVLGLDLAPSNGSERKE